MHVDTLEFARLGQRVEGSLSLDALQRIDAVQRSGALAFSLEGFTDPDGRPFVKLQVTGSIMLTCQRCMAPMQQPVAIDRNLLVARNDAEADAVPLDQDAFDVVVGSAHFDVDALLEDEVILSLPSVPKHDHCPSEGLDDAAIMRPAKESPFAVLKGLKTRS